MNPIEAIAEEALEALTAHGPVILLPDEGEGVKAVRLADVVDVYAEPVIRSTHIEMEVDQYKQAIFDVWLESAREAAK